MMQTHFAQVIQPLKELFLQDQFSDIPEININPNTDLSLIATNVSSLSVTLDPTLTEPEQVSSIFDMITAYTQEPQNIGILQNIDALSKAFATTLESSYTTLNSVITPTIDEIKKELNDRYLVLMTREKAETLVSDQAVPTEADYTFIRWGGLDSAITQNNIVEMACTNAGITTPALSSSNLAYVVRKLSFINEFTEISLPAEVNESLLSKLISIFATGTSGILEEDVRRFWSVITSKQVYSNFCSNATAKLLNFKQLAETCLEMLTVTTDLTQFLNNCKPVIGDDLNPNTLEQLAANIDVVNKTIAGIQYWLLFHRIVKLKDKLIINSSVLNGDNYDELVRDGRSIADVHNYLKAFHLDTTLPVDGISLTSIRSADVNSRLDRVASKLKASETFIKSKCLIGAYFHAINEFINHEGTEVTFPQLQDPIFKSNFLAISKAKASTIAGDIGNIDKILYDLIITTFYHKTLVATLYKYLGKGFDDLADNPEEDVTDERIIEAQCMSICDLLIDYIFDMTTVKE